MKKRYMFSYGSNLNIGQMGFRCPRAVPVGRALLRGYRLEFRGRGQGVATVSQDRYSDVWGAVWEISDECEDMLDDYEGYPAYYEKIDIKVHMADEKSKVMDVMTYQLNHGRFNVPSMRYYNIIKKGYLDFELPVFTLKKAVEEAFDKIGYNKKVLLQYDNLHSVQV